MNKKIDELLYYCLENSSINKIFEWQTQMFIITTKSLIPFENKIGCGIYYNRFIKELELLEEYSNFNNDILKGFDNTIDYKILPIVIANKDWNLIIDEVVKSVILFTYDVKSIILSIILSRMLMEFLNEITEIDSIIEGIKESIIQFSIKDIIEKYYKHKPNSKYLINFERERINWVQNLNNDIGLKDSQLEKSKIYEYIILNKKKTIDIPKQNERIA